MNAHYMVISSLDNMNHNVVTIPENANVVIKYDNGGLDLRSTSLQELIEFYLKGN